MNKPMSYGELQAAYDEAYSQFNELVLRHHETCLERDQAKSELVTVWDEVRSKNSDLHRMEEKCIKQELELRMLRKQVLGHAENIEEARVKIMEDREKELGPYVAGVLSGVLGVVCVIGIIAYIAA